ncbi:unnamed protein product, partial [Owenia fusiformis]
WYNGYLSLKDDEAMMYDLKQLEFPMSEVISKCQNTRDTCGCSSVELMDIDFDIHYERVTLPAYFSIHSKGESPSNPCGDFVSDVGFQQYMAFKYAIDKINNELHLLPNISLGMMAFDTCSNPDYGRQVFQAFDRNLLLMNKPPELPILTYVFAFLGDTRSDVSASLSKANQKGYNLVQISPSSTSDDLSNRASHPLFLRTIPSDRSIVEATVEVIKELGWTYVSTIYHNTTENMIAIEWLQKSLEFEGICLAKVTVVDDTNQDYQIHVDALNKAEGARGVIVFLEPHQFRLLLDAVNSKQILGRFVWISTLDETVFKTVTAGLETVSRGAINVVPDWGYDPDFDKFFMNLKPNSDPNNPWLTEFWEHHFQCNLGHRGKFNQACNGLESLTDSNFKQNEYVANTINAVFAFAKGITAMLQEECGSTKLPHCSAIQPNDTAMPYEYIHRATFKSVNGKRFRFTWNGDGLGEYKILNYQPDNSDQMKQVIIDVLSFDLINALI